MKSNLIFIEYGCYALLKSGEVVEFKQDEILELSDNKSLLECRKKIWEGYYNQDQQSTQRPPWIEKHEINKM